MGHSHTSCEEQVFWLNALPHLDGVSLAYSHQYIMTGQELQYDLHICLKFGEYIQTHEEHTNEMYECTLWGNMSQTHQEQPRWPLVHEPGDWCKDKTT